MPYSTEPHGPPGQYALYFGRDKNHHGLRLCNINDFDCNASDTIKLIETALNERLERLKNA